MERDKRQHVRVASRLRCWCEGSEVTFYARVGNLSEGGLFLKTLTPLHLGARARLRLEHGSHEVAAEARVVWAREDESSEGPPGMGLAFDPLDDAARERLQHMVDHERSRGGVTSGATKPPETV